MQKITISEPEALCVLLKNDHPLADNNTLDISLLKGENLILPPSYTNTYRLVMERCIECGFKPKLRSALRGKDVAATMVKNGIGIPVLCKGPAMAASDDQVKVLEIEPPVMQQIELLFLQRSRQNEAVKTFLNYFKQFARDL